MTQASERILRLKDRYMKTPVASRKSIFHTYGNHPATLYWLEGWLAAAKTAETTIMRRSLAEAAELKNMRCIVTDEELIVGQTDFEAGFENKERFAELAGMFKMAPQVHEDGRSDHMALNYRKLLRVGVQGLIDEIRQEKAKLTFGADEIAENIAKEEFYDAALIELDALLDYAARYEKTLRELAEQADEPRRGELIRMADNLAVVPRCPAKTFWQALQSIHFYTFSLRGLYSAGRPDQYLLPYYEADLASGVLTEDFAQELIENFCLLYSTYVYANTAVGLMVGGTNLDGRPVENALTWAFLRAVDHIRMPDPNLGLCVTDQTSEALLRYAFDMIGRGCTFPSFWNDAEIVRGMVKNGFEEHDAHDYINSTCVELTAEGKSAMWTTAPYHNLTSLLLDVFAEGDYPDYDSLEKAYFNRIREAFAKENHRLNRLKLERARNASEAVRHSCLVDDCIARGKTAGQGGAVYAATLPNVLGFANAIDSLCAIRELVYRRRELTPDEYRSAVANNFEGREALRQRIIHRLPHYGNNEAETDRTAEALARCLSESCEGLVTFHGDRLIPGIFSYNYYLLYGAKTPATPDGRLAGEPLSDSAGPVQGRDVTSPTAALRSGTVWPQSKFLGGVAQNIRLSKHYFENEDMALPISLLRAFFEQGGCELQFNCVNTAELEDAMTHPERHENLLVRIGGYSDYFTHLSPEHQREIIRRTDY